jgi:FtsX-like permease family
VALQTGGVGHAPAVRAGGSFTVRRLRSSRLLLSTVFAAVLVSSAVTGALVTLSLRNLPAAAQSQLERSAGAFIDVTGQLTLSQAATDTSAVRQSLHAAFGPVPVALDAALWSEPLQFPGAAPDAASPGIQVVGQAAAVDAVTTHATLTAGAWPGPLPVHGPVPVAVPAAAAGPLRLSVGEVLTVRNDYTGRPLLLRVTGLYVPRDPAAAYWHISLLGTAGSSQQGAVRTFGPLVTSRAAFRSGSLSVIAASWHAAPALGRVPLGSYGALARRISAAGRRLADPATYGGLVVKTGLPRLLGESRQSLAAGRSVLLISALEMLLLAAASVALAARLLAGQREGESALLSARGMARRQLAGRAAAEATLTLVPAVAGVAAGCWLAGRIFPFAPRAAQLPPFVWGTAAAITIGATLIMIWPVLRPADPVTAGVRRGRQAALAATASAGADIALITVAAVAIWQLRLYARTPTPGGPAGSGAYSVLVVAPTLALAGAALVPLRLLPVAAGGLDRLSFRTRRLGTALASWQLSRRPIRQSGPALLVILAVAIGTMALAEQLSWRRSVQDQADFQVGAAERIDLGAPLPLSTGAAIVAAPGVTGATPVAMATQDGGIELAAVGRQADSTVLLRPDLSPVPAGQLWHSIVPAGRPPGLALPGRPARLEISARLSGRAAAAVGAMSATVSVQDADGIVYTVPAGRLAAGQHRLVAALSPARRAAYPLRLLGVSLAYMLPAARVRGTAAVSISGLSVSPAPAGAFPASFAPGTILFSWLQAATVPASYRGLGVSPPSVRSGPAPAGSASATISPGYGVIMSVSGPERVPARLTLTAPIRREPIPAIATSAFLSVSQATVGSIVPVTASGASLTLRIVGTVRAFPSAGAGQGALIVDQATLQDQLAAASAAPLPVTQWWLRTAARRAPLPAGAVRVTAAAEAAALRADAMSRVQQSALPAIAIAAAVLAVLGFSVSVAASVRERRTQSALLSALGVSRANRTRQLCLEQLMLSAPAAAAGLLLGAGLSWLLVPAVTRTSLGLPPFPPPLVQIPFLIAASLAGAVTAIPVLAAAATVAYQPDPAAQLRAAEAP